MHRTFTEHEGPITHLPGEIAVAFAVLLQLVHLHNLLVPLHNLLARLQNLLS
jgi:hypothetical protein